MQNMMKNLMGDMLKGIALSPVKDMDQKKAGLQVLGFQKNAFDMIYNAIQQTQQQVEKLAEPLLKNMPGVPDDLKNTLKKNQEDFKTAVDESFVKAEAFLSSTCSPEKAEKTKRKAQPKAK